MLQINPLILLARSTLTAEALAKITQLLGRISQR